MGDALSAKPGEKTYGTGGKKKGGMEPGNHAVKKGGKKKGKGMRSNFKVVR